MWKGFNEFNLSSGSSNGVIISYYRISFHFVEHEIYINIQKKRAGWVVQGSFTTSL